MCIEPRRSCIRSFKFGSSPPPQAARPTVGVIIAAFNESAPLPATIDALLRQSDPPDRIWLADDGSSDGSDSVLVERYGLAPAPLGALSEPGRAVPSVAQTRAQRQGACAERRSPSGRHGRRLDRGR